MAFDQTTASPLPQRAAQGAGRGAALEAGRGGARASIRADHLSCPRETRARSLIVALAYGLFWGLLAGLVLGLVLGLNNGGWFVLLQKVAYRRLARAGNLPPRPADFLEWGIEKQIFRRVGGGARFRHGLIQQHLANTSGAAP